MKKNYAVLFTALSSCFAAGSHAQGYITARPRFAHAIGVSANICYTSLTYTQDVASVSESRMTILPGIQYKATFPVSRTSGFSFYPHVGILLEGESGFNSRTGSSSSFEFAWYAGMPVNWEYYFGGMESSYWGAGIGAEYAYFSSLYHSFGYGTSVAGPNIAVSKQFRFRETSHAIIRLGFTYNILPADHPAMYDVSKDSRSLISLSLLYGLGIKEG